MAKRQPVSIPMEDPVLHTVEQPICGDPACICAQLEYEQLIADNAAAAKKQKPHHTTLVEKEYDVLSSTLNYRNEGFHLLKQPRPQGRNNRQ